MLILLLAGILALIYGALIAFIALKEMRKQILTPSQAATIGFVGLIIMFSALFIPFRIPSAFYVLLIGLVAMHLLTLKNGKTEPKEQTIRLAASLIILVMAFVGVFIP